MKWFKLHSDTSYRSDCWRADQIGVENVRGKPVLILNADGYFDPLREMIGNTVTRGFLGAEDSDYVCFFPDVGPLLSALEKALDSR